MDIPSEKRRGKITRIFPQQPKCLPCRLVLIAAITLFISALLLAGFELERSHGGVEEVGQSPKTITPEQVSQRMHQLRSAIDAQQGSSTIIIGNKANP
jgi:hypothetical protein